MGQEPDWGSTKLVRLAISVEGLTEERFIRMVMGPYLQERDIYTTPVLLGGNGGHVTFPRIKKDLNNLANSFDKVSTLYDYYGFRGKEENESKATLENKILDCVATPLQARIIPYVQMYEFEGILFSSPEAIENNINQLGLAEWAKTVLQQFGDNPEKINDSKLTAPSKRLLNQASYIKTVHGPDIGKEIGIDMLRERCTGFDSWISGLEGLSV